jgi:hypothetical protein
MLGNSRRDLKPSRGEAPPIRRSILKLQDAPLLVSKRKNSKHEQVELMRPFIPSVLLFSVLFAAAQSQPAPQIGYKSAADAEQKKTLLLRDFEPVSMLDVPAHKVDKTKFYVIDVHNHVNDAARIDDHIPPEPAVEVMDHTNVKTVVMLTAPG